MKKWFNTNKLYISGALMGALTGYFYWQQIGCISGTCAVTSNPFNSTIYGAALGALLLGMFKKENSKQVLKEKT